MRPSQRLNALLTTLGPGLRPVLLGSVVGLVALAGMSVELDRGQMPEPPPRQAADRDIDAPKKIVRARRPSAEAGQILDLFLPPRKAATDLTWRIENGLPRREPAARPDEAPPPAQTAAAPAGLPADDRPRIALVIDDMGFDRENSARAVRLPAAVTLAYLPFAPAVSEQVAEARKAGHQVMLHLPMEADEHLGRPGRKVLSIRNGDAEARSMLVEMLRSFTGYIGVNNHQGSRFTRDPRRMALVMHELKRRGLFFLDSRTSGGSVGADVAAYVGIPHAERDVFLDHDPSRIEIAARMADAERVARAKGHAVVIGHPRDATLDLLAPWIVSLTERGFALIPVSQVLRHPARPAEPKKLAQAETGE